MTRLLVVLVLLAACSRGDYRAARGVHNDGVAALAEGDWKRAEEAFLRARSEAGVDPELRWRAAYHLGLAYAGHAASVEDPEEQMSLYATAATWFQDAVRLRPDDAEARANLEIVRARQQALADQLVAGEKALEKKLERLIEAQREVRDGARGLLEAARAGGAVSPVALEEQARALATTERTLLADAGVVVDLAGADLDRIGALPDDQKQDQDQVRQIQLQQLEQWMQIARSALADTRRLLDEVAFELAHQRAEEAVEALKRASEQLLDPVAVLRAIAVDEYGLAQETAYLEHARAEQKKLEGEPVQVPAWLTAEHLAGRQTDAGSRLGELVLRLGAAAGAPAPQDPAQARLLERVKIALPELETASAAMTRSRDALVTGALPAASAAQTEALIALGRAIEQFVDLRAAIDLAWEEQGRIAAAIEGGDPKQAREVREGIARNLGRMTLLQGLITDAREQAAAEQQPTEVFDQAEPLRAQAEAALRALAAGDKRPLDRAREVHARLTELRTLFFSVIEHLQELIRQQGETRDDSAAAAGLDDLGRAPLLPGLIGRQGEHRQMAQAIADALAQQADAAAQQPAPQPAQPGAPDPAALGAAAEEVRGAVGDMDAAGGELERARDPAQTVSVDLTPALDAQQGAIDHLQAALAILQPPPPEQQQQDQQDQQQDQQQQQQQQQDQQQQEAQSVERRRERVREQEAERRRERQERQRSPQDPVEKDW